MSKPGPKLKVAPVARTTRVRCLGVGDEHEFFSAAPGERICARCRRLIDGRLRFVSRIAIAPVLTPDWWE